ncbi:RnfH family protein [Dyella sp. BiH032]|uniref:RnfH family protein n=1 Tax=Dyella sp. BiH032 TaxID=3075430 RepID=UPI0028929A06|nr:RnfH family protein [Dyella sp. BiH032]WNL48111.1 RnfH family protein [Dyella sp. BiH032]
MVERIAVEVVYAEAGRQWVLPVELPAGATVMQAIEASGLLAEVPGLEVDPARLGVFSRKAAPDRVLEAGDRVEIYRPLTLDPKEARRRRAQGG